VPGGTTINPVRVANLQLIAVFVVNLLPFVTWKKVSPITTGSFPSGCVQRAKK
jgi:hypothetical protein